jgi:hypothetical protein
MLLYIFVDQLDMLSVQKLALGYISFNIKIYSSHFWTVLGSNPGGGGIFLTRLDWAWGLSSLLYNGYRVFPGGKAAGAWC